MEKCINCNKEYTIRGMKLHRKKCDEKYILIKKKEDEKKEKDSKKIKIGFSHDEKIIIGNYLPDDCIKIIYEYLLLEDRNISSYKLYNDINNISLVCKSFYLNRPNIEYLKKKIQLEMNEMICRSWSMDIYGLTDDEMELLDYKIVSRAWKGNMHLFNIVEVKELAYKKYGTEYDYNNYLKKKANIKLLSKKEKDLIYKERQKIYEELFLKYDYKKKSYLEEIYQYYGDYIKKGVPRISTIEDEIKNTIHKISIRDNLIIELNKKNIDYFETKEVLYYLYGCNKKNQYSLASSLFIQQIEFSNYNINIVIESLKNRMIKEEIYKNLNKDEYSSLAYKFINNSDKNMDTFINLLNNLELINKYMDNNQKIPLKTLCDENNIEFYLDNIIHKWCNTNKNNNIETFDFIKKLDDQYQKKIKKQFLLYEEEKQKILNQKIIREKIINNFKNGFKNKDTLFCLCNNAASIKCINYMCGKCCNNINCKKHGNCLVYLDNIANQ
jgi:hypothetical protein